MTTIYTTLRDVPNETGKYRIRIPVTTDTNGLDVVIWAHAFVGSRPGPTLTLLSGLHGNEWLHLEYFRRLMNALDAEALSGRVVIVPMANQVAFGSLSRHVPDDSDNADANRAFPVKNVRHTWLAEQIATKVANEVLTESDYLLDFHLGMWGSTLGSSIVGIDYSDNDINGKSQALSFAFGNPLIYFTRMVGHFPGPRSSQGYAGEVLKIPCCGSMLGGAGFDKAWEESWLEANLQGIRNVMIHTGIADGDMKLPEKYLVYETVQRINPTVGGLLVPANYPETFAREITEGEVLGHVVSPLTFDVLEELTVPFDGYLAYWARTYPVRPGDWAYCVIPKDHPGTRWVDQPQP